MSEMEAVEIVVSDVTGQRSTRVRGISKDKKIADLVQELLSKLGLATRDRAGNPLAYHARLDHERRRLHGGERVGDVLEDDNEITLLPRIDAGRR